MITVIMTMDTMFIRMMVTTVVMMMLLILMKIMMKTMLPTVMVMVVMVVQKVTVVTEDPKSTFPTSHNGDNYGSFYERDENNYNSKCGGGDIEFIFSDFLLNLTKDKDFIFLNQNFQSSLSS